MTFFGTLTIFILAMFLGWELITKVPPTLHTPLMSGSNAVSGITVIGAILVAGGEQNTLANALGFAWDFYKLAVNLFPIRDSSRG